EEGSDRGMKEAEDEDDEDPEGQRSLCLSKDTWARKMAMKRSKRVLSVMDPAFWLPPEGCRARVAEDLPGVGPVRTVGRFTVIERRL
ncbi:hypothetical protein HK101_010001, partial [Irineochytrium annulatum]